MSLVILSDSSLTRSGLSRKLVNFEKSGPEQNRMFRSKIQNNVHPQKFAPQVDLCYKSRFTIKTLSKTTKDTAILPAMICGSFTVMCVAPPSVGQKRRMLKGTYTDWHLERQTSAHNPHQTSNITANTKTKTKKHIKEQLHRNKSAIKQWFYVT